MKEAFSWVFPDQEKHFIDMIAKGVKKGRPAEYQYQARDKALEYVKTFNRAIDVGANVGLWSRPLSEKFQVVESFEPMDVFTECLKINAPKAIIHKVALGESETTVDLILTEENTGNTHVDSNTIGKGSLPMKTLDSFKFEEVNFIKLDCEGFEVAVIKGAVETLLRCKPIIVVEQKPHLHFAAEWGQYAAIDFLKSISFKVIDRVNDDWILGF